MDFAHAEVVLELQRLQCLVSCCVNALLLQQCRPLSCQHLFTLPQPHLALEGGGVSKGRVWSRRTHMSQRQTKQLETLAHPMFSVFLLAQHPRLHHSKNSTSPYAAIPTNTHIVMCLPVSVCCPPECRLCLQQRLPQRVRPVCLRTACASLLVNQAEICVAAEGLVV